MLTLQVHEKNIDIVTAEEFVRGTVSKTCQIDLDEFWADYAVTAVFKRCYGQPINIILDKLSNTITIPYEVMAESGSFRIGIFGTKTDTVLPTLWSEDIKVKYGTDTIGTEPKPYTPSEIEQLKQSKQDKLTAGDNITIDGNNVISANVPEITIDNKLSETSENAVQNKVITANLNNKQNKFATVTHDGSTQTVKIDDTLAITTNPNFSVDQIISTKALFLAGSSTAGVRLEKTVLGNGADFDATQGYLRVRDNPLADDFAVNKKYVNDIKTELLKAINHPYTYDETTKELTLIL